MSINSLSSLGYQPLLPHVEVVEQEIIHQWDVNDFVVCLIKKQDALGKDTLEYKTIKNQIEIYTEHIEIPESKSLEIMLSQLKACKVMLDENGIATFSRSYHTWVNNAECECCDAEINLIRGSEGLIWNVFQRIIKRSSFYTLQEATIPSLRCHPKTIFLIEKIKEEAFKNPQLQSCLMKDFKIKITDIKILQEEHEKLHNSYSEGLNNMLKKNNLLTSTFLIGSGSGALYSCLTAIATSMSNISALCGGGLIGTFAGGVLGIGSGAFVFSGGFLTAGVIALYIMSDRLCVFNKNIKVLENKVRLLTPKIQSPLFIEVEPISFPSVIDERVRVSKFTWAVTLVTHDGSNGNHAEIIVEGINDGFYDEDAPLIGKANKVEVGEKFIHLSHYTPRLQSGLLSPDDLEYETRTEIWMVPSDQVKKMLMNIEEEKYLPKDQRRTFNRLGKDSKFHKLTWDKKWQVFSGEVGDNCFTWAREKLKILNIDLGKDFTDFVAAMAKNYTRNKESYKDIPVQEMI